MGGGGALLINRYVGYQIGFSNRSLQIKIVLQDDEDYDDGDHLLQLLSFKTNLLHCCEFATSNAYCRHHYFDHHYFLLYLLLSLITISIIRILLLPSSIVDIIVITPVIIALNIIKSVYSINDKYINDIEYKLKEARVASTEFKLNGFFEFILSFCIPESHSSFISPAKPEMK